jgi:hypothetical protein
MRQASENSNAPTPGKHAGRALSGFHGAIAGPPHRRLPPASLPGRAGRRPAFFSFRPPAQPRRPWFWRIQRRSAPGPSPSEKQPHEPLAPNLYGQWARPPERPDGRLALRLCVQPRVWQEQTWRAPAHAKQRERGAWENRPSLPERRRSKGWSELSSGLNKIDSNLDQISTSFLWQQPKALASKNQARSRQPRPAP